MDKPYIVTCKVCGGKFCSDSRSKRIHAKCKTPKRKGHIGLDLEHTIKARDKMTCQECGITGINDFEVHHINENWKDNRTNNLILLCRKCHRAAHKNGLPEYKVKKVKILKEPPCRKPKKKKLFKNI